MVKFETHRSRDLKSGAAKTKLLPVLEIDRSKNEVIEISIRFKLDLKSHLLPELVLIAKFDEAIL